MDNMAVERIGPYLAVTDGDGLRHLIRIGSIQMLSDGDLCRDTAVIVVAGRAILVAEPVDEIIAKVASTRFSP